MKKMLCLLMLILACQAGFGQLTNTSEQDDSLQIQIYVRNSAAILDSLTKYEFSKKRLGQFQTALNSKNNLLQKYSAENLSLRVSVGVWHAKFLTKEANFNRANIERWVYRAAIITAAAIFIKQKIP